MVPKISIMKTSQNGVYTATSNYNNISLLLENNIHSTQISLCSMSSYITRREKVDIRWYIQHMLLTAVLGRTFLLEKMHIVIQQRLIMKE